MTAQAVSSATMLFFSSEELQTKCLDPEDITLPQVLELIHSVFDLSGLLVPSHSEIQVFSTHHGILLFLCPIFSQTTQFALSSSVLS